MLLYKSLVASTSTCSELILSLHSHKGKRTRGAGGRDRGERERGTHGRGERGNMKLVKERGGEIDRVKERE